MAEAFNASVGFPGLKESVNEWTRLGEAIDDAGDSAKSGGGSFAGLARDFNEVVEASKKLYAGIGKVFTAMQDMAGEMERQVGILNRFNGNVDEAARRTNGLLTQLDLMVASNTAAAAGLQLTGTQFANLAVAAAEFAAATGGDAAEAMEKLTRAVAMGEEGALREFNISLGEAKTQAERQSAALADLAAKYGDAESSADTLAGQLQVLSNRLDDAQTEFFETIDKSGALERSFANLRSTADLLLGTITDVDDDGLSAVEHFAINAGAFIEALSEKIQAFVEQLQLMKELTEIIALSGGTIDGVIDAFQSDAAAQLGRAIVNDASIGDRQQRLAGESTAFLREKGGPRGTTVNPGGGTNRAGGGGRDEEAERLRDIEIQIAEKAKEQAEIADRLASLKRQSADEAQREADILEKQIVAAEAERLASAQEELALKQKLNDIERERVEIAQEQEEAQKRSQAAADRARQGFQGVLDIGFKTAELAEQANVSVGEAFASALDHWLAAFAKQQLLQAAEQFAMAIGLAFTNPPAAASKAAAGAAHLAVAALAGGASAAIPGGGGGGGAARPEATGGGGGGQGGGGDTYVINQNNPVSRAESGREQARAMRTARRQGRS